MATTTAPAPAELTPSAPKHPFAITSARSAPSRLLANLALAVVFVVFLAPILWLILGSVHADSGLTVQFGGHYTLGNFRDIMTVETLWKPILNSLILAGGTAILTVVVAALAAYPLSRYQMRFRNTFLYTILFSTGLPLTAIMVPVYVMFVHFNLTDKLSSTVLFMTASALPFAIWMMKNFMDGVPIVLEEAAWTDGAGWFASLRRVVMPLMAPGVVVVAIFVFVTQWGDFFIPFILLQDPTKQPAAVTIYTFFNAYGQVAYGQLAAFSILYTLPIVLLYGVLSKSLGGAFSFAGGVKG